MCLEYIGELGEEVIYDHFLERKSLENLMCRSQQLGNICPPKKKKKKAKKDKKPKEELWCGAVDSSVCISFSVIVF